MSDCIRVCVCEFSAFIVLYGDLEVGWCTVLDAVLEVVDDGFQDGGETHDLSTLSQPQSE